MENLLGLVKLLRRGLVMVVDIHVQGVYKIPNDQVHALLNNRVKLRYALFHLLYALAHCVLKRRGWLVALLVILLTAFGVPT